MSSLEAVRRYYARRAAERAELELETALLRAWFPPRDEHEPFPLRHPLLGRDVGKEIER